MNKIYREALRIWEQITNYFPYIFIWYWKKWQNTIDGVVVYLKYPMHYAMFANIHRYLPDIPIVAGNKKTADYLVNHQIPCTRRRLYPRVVIMADYCQNRYPVRAIKKIQIFHGICCKNYFFDKVTNEHICLVSGNAWVEKLYQAGVKNLEVIGYPKTDGFFQGSWNRVELLQNMGGDIRKKTILYAPSWEKLSSVDKLVQAIGQLSNDYNVLVKLHEHSMDRWREIYRNIPNVIFLEDADITRCLYVADLLISDFSSTIFEFAQLFRPIIVFGISDEDLKANAPDPGWWEIAERIDVVEKLGQRIAALLEGDWKPNARYGQIVDAIFAYRDGFCAQRAAKIIEMLKA